MQIYRLFLTLFIISTSLRGQIGVPIPEWVKPVKFAETTVNKNLVKDGYYYVLVDEQYNTIKQHSFFRYALSATTEEALTTISQIEFKFDPVYQKAVIHKVLVHRNGTTFDRTKSVELKQLNEESRRSSGVLSGLKTYYVNLSDIRKNDVVEYSYSINGCNPILKNHFDFDLFLSYGVPVGKIYLRLISKKGVDLNIKQQNTDQKPVVIETNFKETEWEVVNPKIVNSESSTPYWYNAYARLQISDLFSWLDVKKHCCSLFVLPKYNQKELHAIVDSIVDATQNLEMRITSIIEFVQTHIRYSGNENGIYSHVPRTPDFVIKNRYGDCKEKSVLLCEMLKMIGIEANPVLINSSKGDKVVEEVPAINAFDHCIASFIYKGQIFFIDPTISSQRGHFKFRAVPNYEIGMILDNSDNPFTKIPVNLLAHCSVLEEFIVEKSGSARLKVKTVYTGSDADEIRSYFLTNSTYDIQDSYKSFYSKFGEDIMVLDTVKYEDRDATNELVTFEDYIFPKFWVPSDSTKSKIVAKDFMPYSLNQRLNYGDEVTRKEPLRLNYPVSHSHTIVVTKGGGWNVEETFKKEDNKLFSYIYKINVDGDKLLLQYMYSSKANVVMPADYAEYKRGMDFVNHNMVFSSEEKPLADGVLGFNWPLLLSLLLGVGGSIVLIFYLVKRKVITSFQTKYESIGGWLILIAISITLNPVTLLISIFREYWGEWGVNYMEFFFNENSSYFSPLRGWYSLLLPFCNMFFLVYSIFLLPLFYGRKSSFRAYYCIFKLTNTVFILISVIVLYFMYSGTTDLEERKLLSAETTGLVRSIVGTAIWVPYIWYSERSRHTFTVGNIEPSEGNTGGGGMPSSSSLNQ